MKENLTGAGELAKIVRRSDGLLLLRIERLAKEEFARAVAALKAAIPARARRFEAGNEHVISNWQIDPAPTIPTSFCGRLTVGP